jgi:hypothetical protein
MADGRVFVTDGGFALDAAVARPKTMPPDIKGGVAAQALARHLALHNPTEVRLGDLKTGARPNTFIAPGGTIVNGNYVSFLRRAAPAATLRMKGPVDPVVIVLGGAPVGVFMPIKP